MEVQRPVCPGPTSHPRTTTSVAFVRRAARGYRASTRLSPDAIRACGASGLHCGPLDHQVQGVVPSGVGAGTAKKSPPEGGAPSGQRDLRGSPPAVRRVVRPVELRPPGCGGRPDFHGLIVREPGKLGVPGRGMRDPRRRPSRPGERVDLAASEQRDQVGSELAGPTGCWCGAPSGRDRRRPGLPARMRGPSTRSPRCRPPARARPATDPVPPGDDRPTGRPTPEPRRTCLARPRPLRVSSGQLLGAMPGRADHDVCRSRHEPRAAPGLPRWRPRPSEDRPRRRPRSWRRPSGGRWRGRRGSGWLVRSRCPSAPRPRERASQRPPPRLAGRPRPTRHRCRSGRCRCRHADRARRGGDWRPPTGPGPSGACRRRGRTTPSRLAAGVADGRRRLPD